MNEEKLVGVLVRMTTEDKARLKRAVQHLEQPQADVLRDAIRAYLDQVEAQEEVTGG